MSDAHCSLVVCRLDELQPHASYVRHRLSVSALQLSNLIAISDLAFREPTVITRDHKIIDGYARLELARRQGRIEISCLRYDLSEQESLHWLIQSHLPSPGLLAYSRILLALDLEPFLEERAWANQQAGGRHKLSSNLTEAKALDVRSKIAEIAAVSTGNVTKVKQLMEKAHGAIEQALREGEISIHRAWQWSQQSPTKQLENLRLLRIERGIKKKAEALVREHGGPLLRSGSDPVPFTQPDVINLVNCLSTMSQHEPSAFEAVALRTVDVPGNGIYVTQELVRITRPPQEEVNK